MTGKQRGLCVLFSFGSLFGGGALCKTNWGLGSLFGCLLMLWGTIALATSLTEPGEGKAEDDASKENVADKILDGKGAYGCLLHAMIIGVFCAIGYLESIRGKVGFSIVGVIIVGTVFALIGRVGNK